MTDDNVRLPRPVGDVGDNPLRTPENAELLLIEFACGGTWKTVAQKLACTEPAIKKWFMADPELHQRYIMAKELSTHWSLDEIEELGREAMTVNVYPEYYTNPDGTPMVDDEGQPVPHPKAGEPLPTEKDKSQRIRAAMEAKKIAIEKRAPKQFGNLLKLADADGNAFQVVLPDYAHQELIQGPVVDAEATEVEATEVTPDG